MGHLPKTAIVPLGSWGVQVLKLSNLKPPSVANPKVASKIGETF